MVALKNPWEEEEGELVVWVVDKGEGRRWWELRVWWRRRGFLIDEREIGGEVRERVRRGFVSGCGT